MKCDKLRAEDGPVVEQLAAVGDYRAPIGRLADLPEPPRAPAGTRPLTEVLAELRNEEVH